MEGAKDINYLLGEMSGKMDGVLSSISSMTTTFASHTEQDSKNFSDIRIETAIERTRIAKLMGGIAVVVSLISFTAPSILSSIFK